MATFQLIGTIILIACALGILYGMFRISRHDRNDVSKKNEKTMNN